MMSETTFTISELANEFNLIPEQCDFMEVRKYSAMVATAKNAYTVTKTAYLLSTLAGANILAYEETSD